MTFYNSAVELANEYLRERLYGTKLNSDTVIHGLLDRIAELEKDRVRLDWLLVNEIRLVWSASDRKYYTVKEDGSIIGPGASWKKAAIDAAMAAERED